MHLPKLILILFITIFIVPFKLSWAQERGASVSEIEQVKAELLQQVVENQKKQEYRPKWQEDFEAMQVQANDSMAQNTRLNIEYKLLEKEAIRIRISEKEPVSSRKCLMRKDGRPR
jgi:hypothetical protein